MFATAKRKIADQGPAPDNEDVFEVRVYPNVIQIQRQTLYHPYRVISLRSELTRATQDDEPSPDDDETSQKADEAKSDDEANDVSKDKLIKALGAGKGKAKAKPKTGAAAPKGKKK